MGIRAFELERVLEMDPEFLTDSEHEHDATVTSVGFELCGELRRKRRRSSTASWSGGRLLSLRRAQRGEGAAQTRGGPR